MPLWSYLKLSTGKNWMKSFDFFQNIFPIWFTEAWNSPKKLWFLSLIIASFPFSSLTVINWVPWFIYEGVWTHQLRASLHRILSGRYLPSWRSERMSQTLEKTRSVKCWLTAHFPLYTVINNACMCAKLFQLCLTHCNPIDCSPPGSFVHGISQTRKWKWVATSSSRTSLPRGWTQVSCIERWALYYHHYLGSPNKQNNII